MNDIQDTTEQPVIKDDPVPEVPAIYEDRSPAQSNRSAPYMNSGGAQRGGSRPYNSGGGGGRVYQGRSHGGHGGHGGPRGGPGGRYQRGAPGPNYSGGPDNETRKLMRLKKLIVFLGERTNNNNQMSVYDRSVLSQIVELDHEIENSVVPPMAKNPSKKGSAFARMDVVNRNKVVVLDTIRNVIMQTSTKSSLLALLMAIWTHGHHGRWADSGEDNAVKRDGDLGEDIVIKTDDVAMEDTPVIKTQDDSEIIKGEDTVTKIDDDELVKEEIASKPKLTWQANHSIFYLDLVKQTVGRIHTAIENLIIDCEDQEPQAWYTVEAQVTNGLRFLMELANVRVIDIDGVVDWINAMLKVVDTICTEQSSGQLKDETVLGACAASIINMVLSCLNEASASLIRTHHDIFVDLNTKIQVLLQQTGFPKSLTMKSSTSAFYNDEVSLEGISELHSNWHAFQELVNVGQSNRFRLAFYDYPIVCEDPSMKGVITPSPSYRPIVLRPLRTEQLAERFWSTNLIDIASNKTQLAVFPTNTVVARYNYSLLSTPQLKKILPRVVHFSPAERTMVERYIRHTLVTYSEDANEAARAVLSIPLIHDSITMVMIDVIFQDIVRCPNGLGDQAFYLKVLFAMTALEPSIAKGVEIAVVTAMENLADLGTGILALESFYGSWWSYLSSDPEDESAWMRERGSDFDRMVKFVEDRGEMFLLRYWYSGLSNVKKDEIGKAEGDKQEEDKTGDSKRDAKRLMELSDNIELRQNHPLVANFLRKSVEQFVFCVSASTAKTRLIGPLLNYIPVGESRPILEYMPIAQSLVKLMTSTNGAIKDEDMKFEESYDAEHLDEDVDPMLHYPLLDRLTMSIALKGIEEPEQKECRVAQLNIARLVRTVDLMVPECSENFIKEEIDPEAIGMNEEIKVEEVKFDEEGEIVLTTIDSVALNELSHADKAFSLLVMAFLVRGHPTPAHFTKIVKLYSCLITPFTHGSTPEAQANRLALVVEILRCWQTNPVRLTRDLRTLVRAGIITIDDCIAVLCDAIQRPEQVLVGLCRLGGADAYHATFDSGLLLPNSFIHSQYLNFILADITKMSAPVTGIQTTEAMDEAQPVDMTAVLESLVKLIVCYAIRGCSRGKDYNNITRGVDMEMQLHIHRSMLITMQLVEKCCKLFQSEAVFQLQISAAIAPYTAQSSTTYISREELEAAVKGLFNELAQ